MNDNIAKSLEDMIVVPPAIAILLAFFGILLVNNELKVFGRIKIAYHHLQDKYWDMAIEDPSVKEHAKHSITVNKLSKNKFVLYVRFYMFLLLLLSIGNLLFIILSWIEHLDN